MAAVVDEHDTQTVGDFLDWLLYEGGYQICRYVPSGREGRFDPVHNTPQTWLAERHGIDLEKVEAEREAILENLRERDKIRELQSIAADTAGA